MSVCRRCGDDIKDEGEGLMYGFVYKIENLVNGKVYIGQSIDPERREKEHFYNLETNKHHNNHLQNAFNKYGEDYFKHNIITWCNSKEELDKQETHLINKYDALNSEKGYNLKSGGANGKHSLKSRLKMRKSHAGEKNNMFGKIPWNKGKKMPEISGENNPNYRKNFSIETRKKMSEASKGRKHSIETRKKMSDNNGKSSWHGFKGANYSSKKPNPWNRVWSAKIYYNGKQRSLGVFNDPLSAELVRNLVKNEIYGGVDY